MMRWFGIRNMFPPLMILRRYLKLVYRYCENAGLLNSAVECLDSAGAPFTVTDIPIDYPSPANMKL